MATSHDRIARRAYEFFEARGKQQGQDWADWFQAEREIRDGSRLRYFSLAVQYYVAGRFAVHSGLNPVAGNLLHHAIELALKGGLARATSSEDLKKKYMHSLSPLWRDFKLSVSDPRLDRLDRTVGELDQFETIRYPEHVEQYGMFASITPTRRDQDAKAPTRLPSTVPRYKLYLPEIDELLDAVFAGASINPEFFKGEIKSEAADFLARDNATRLRDLSP
jgi:Protein of unknown function (DUF2934)